jgi:hypothetical protein
MHEPELDDGYFEEIDWLLGLFVKGLRSKAVRFITSPLLLFCTSHTNINLGYGDLPPRKRLRAYPFSLPIA